VRGEEHATSASTLRAPDFLDLERLARPKTSRRYAKKQAKRPPAIRSFDLARDLSTHGLASDGPIASGAFVMVLRAHEVTSGRLVAVKSYDATKCIKEPRLGRARDAEVAILRLLRQRAEASSVAWDGDAEAQEGGQEQARQQQQQQGQGQGQRQRQEQGQDSHNPVADDGAEAAGATEAVESAGTAAMAAVANRDGGRASSSTTALEAAVEACFASSVLGGHPHVVNLVDELSLPAATHLVLEFCAGGTLERHLERLRKLAQVGTTHFGLGEDTTASLTHQLASALSHLHGLGVAHRSVQPSNVLFVRPGERHVKLCDLAFATRCGKRPLRERLDTPIDYWAAELCNLSFPHSVGYLGPAVDCWALGAVVYECLHSVPTFRRGGNDDDTLVRIRSGDVELRRGLSHAARTLILGLLAVDVDTRWCADDVLAHGYAFTAASSPVLPASASIEAEVAPRALADVRRGRLGLPPRARPAVHDPLLLYDATHGASVA